MENLSCKKVFKLALAASLGVAAAHLAVMMASTAFMVGMSVLASLANQ